MTRRLGGLMVCLVLCLPVGVPAQEVAGSAPSDEATHQALRALKTDMEQALNARDLDRLLSHLHKDVVFTTMNNDVRIGKDAIRSYYTEMMSGPGAVVKTLEAKFDVDALTRLYGNTGLAQGSSNDHYVLNDGSDLVVHGRWSCTLLKEGDQWLIASFHYSTNVFDNPVLDMVKSKAATFGAAAAAALLVVGLVIGLAAGRRKARA
jgi:uncharacterized protein (TIGR02246 family)